MEAKDDESESDADGARDGAGEQSHQFDRGPDDRVLEAFTHLPECRGLRGSCARKVVQGRACKEERRARSPFMLSPLKTSQQFSASCPHCGCATPLGGPQKFDHGRSHDRVIAGQVG